MTKGTRLGSAHDEQYWSRLRRDFHSCTHWFATSYSAGRAKDSEIVAGIRQSIDERDPLIMTKPTAEHRRHWDRVADLGGILTGGPAEIAHCHGGSMKLLGPDWQPGMGQRQDHWLVIPLNWKAHRGRVGLDSFDEGVDKWEAYWGKTQIELLIEVSDRLGYCVFAKAGVQRPTTRTDPKPSAPSASI